MHKILVALLFTRLLGAQAVEKNPLREVLLEQLHTTHDKKDWFVSIKEAVDGVTADQAKWVDGHGNHSIGQLVNHMAFWNERALQKFRGEKPAAFNGNNDETFNAFDATTWSAAVAKLDAVMKAWESAVETADDATIKASASQIAHVGAHNAYHLGQIVYIRKLQGSWNPDNGVK